METIGKYRILGTLGKGGMGIVYKAMDPDIEREVAIKTVQFDLLDEGLEKENLLARVVREAKAAGRLNHPNIITIYDVFRDGDMTYIVMQYIDGQSLYALLASGKSFSPREILNTLKPVAEALDFAHRNGIIHRDIKPANILIDKSGRPFLADFGVARILTSTMTQTGTTVGTLNYMSPEQIKGQTVDSRSDVFALGVILYELLTGKKPFAGDNMSTIVYQIVNEDPQPVSDINKDLHGGYERVVGKALAKRPEDRYQTCLEMIVDLENPGLMAEATLAYEIEPGAGPEPQKRKTGLFVAAAVAVVAVLAGGAYLLFSSRPAKSSESAKNTVTTKTEKPNPAAPSAAPVPSAAPAAAGVETAASEDGGLVRLRQSFDAKSYEETVRLAKAVLAEEPDNAPALDYLSKANAAIRASELAQSLQSGIAAYGSGDFARCVVEMRKVLAVDKTNQEALKYLLQAETALAAPEIKRLIESHRAAVENKDLLTVLSFYDPSIPADSLQSEFKLLFNGYDGIKSVHSQVAISLSGAQGAKAGFSELLTAVSKKTGQREIYFEGQRTWRLRKLQTGWKISASQ